VSETPPDKPLTGRKVAVIAVSAFAVVIAVNMVLAWQAVSTFPGLEARNGYVASQGFEARRAAQKALGWSLDVTYARGELVLSFHDDRGVPIEPVALEVLVGRSTVAADDRRPVLEGRDGHYRAPLALEPGKWLVRVEAESPDGTRFRQRRDIRVGG